MSDIAVLGLGDCGIIPCSGATISQDIYGNWANTLILWDQEGNDVYQSLVISPGRAAYSSESTLGSVFRGGQDATKE